VPKVYDASWQRPAPTKLAPGDGIILYASRTGSKCPSAAECAAYRARGVVVRFVFEDSATRAADGGYADGHADGALTLAQAAAKGGQRGDVAYFACDTNSPLHLEYARGFRDGLAGYFTAGLYAGDRNLERARVGLGITKLWQAGAASWSDHWNYDAHHGSYAHASLYQVVTSSPIPGTDLNVINDPGWAGLTGTNLDILEDDLPTAKEIAEAVVAEPIENTLVEGGLSEPLGTRVLKAQAYANAAQTAARQAVATAAATQELVAQIISGATVIDYDRIDNGVKAALATLHLEVG